MHGRAGARPTQRAAASGLRPAAPLPFVVVLDVTIVTTALPAIRQGLEFTDNELQWVFTRVRAGLRRTADLRRPRGRCSGSTTNFPHRSRAVLGRVCGLRPRVVARNSRGRPGTAGCRSGPALARCTGRAHDAQPAWRSAAACCGLVDRSRGRWWASGWVLGGFITEYAGWRWAFAVNVPIGLVALTTTPLLLPPDQQQTERRRLDLGGALTAVAGLALLVYGLTNAGHRGLDRPSSWLPLLLAALAFTIFVRHESQAPDPLVPPRLLGSRPVAGANLTALAITASTSPAMYLAVLYVQQTLGLPPGRASLLFPSVNLGVIAGSLCGPRFLGRLGARRTLLAGFAGITAGSTMLVALPPEGLPVVQLLGAFAVMGAGLGIASVASTQTGTDAADPAYRGVASGVLNSAAQVGTAVGVALLLRLATAVGLDTMAGYRTGFVGAGAIAVAGAIGSLLVPPVRSLITCSSSGVVTDASKQDGLKGNDHHDNARSSPGAWG